MDTSKYTTPMLPTTQNILDDLSGSCPNKINEGLKITSSDGVLYDTYKSYMNVHVLKRNLLEQEDLNIKLRFLNKQLLRNIDDMKKQQ